MSEEIDDSGPQLQAHEHPSLDEVQSSLERLLSSRTFRDVDGQKSFIRYTVEETLQGRGGLLKEYAIGTNALNRTQSFDPRVDPIVRVQAGKLRARLIKYYESEGKDDPLRIDFPKGGYAPIFHYAATDEPQFATETVTAPGATPEDGPNANAPRVVRTLRRSRFQILIAAALLIAVVGWISTALRLRSEVQASAGLRAAWSPELQELWAPFIQSDRPLVLSIGAPLFAQMRSSTGLTFNFRGTGQNDWAEVQGSRITTELRKLLGNPDYWPSYWVQMGEVEAAFRAGKILAPHVPNLSFDRSSHFSWQQAASNNMILIGSPSVFRELLKEIPLEQKLVLEDHGVRNLQPDRGEEKFLSESTYGYDGEGYVLITRAPGPQGGAEVETFIANSTAARLAAVEWFTDPTLARSLVNYLRRPSGTIPPYYQLVLRVKYKDMIPIATSYVVHREVHPINRVAVPN